MADRRWATLSRGEADGEVFVAVNEGVLVKIGDQVQVSVRRASGGSVVTSLRDAVRRDYLTLDALELAARAATQSRRTASSAASRGSMLNDPTPSDVMAKQVASKAERKLRARRDGAPGVWSGLGMMGLIGWSVVVPTLLGAAMGVWLDSHHPGAHQWSLALMMAGAWCSAA